MNRRITHIVAVLACASTGVALAQPASKAPSPPAAAPAPPPPPARDATAVARDIMAFYKTVDGMSADFTQVVRKRGIKNGLRRSGKVYLRKGRTTTDKDGKAQTEQGRMRWDYPSEEVFYFSDGETLWTYERRERVALRLPVKDSRLYQATGYLLGQGDLAADFDLKLATSPVKGTLALEMVPKEGTAVMQKLTLLVDEKTAAVVGSILVDPIGDSTSLFFAELKYGALEDSTFAWKPPAGVTIRTP